MGDFFQKLLDKIYEFWPIRIIDAGCQGVLWKHDGTVKCLQPGWHFFWPKLWLVDQVNVQYQNIDCGTQPLTTKDGKQISISLNVAYSIKDAAILRATYQHFDTTIVNDARGHAAEIIVESTWDEILSDPIGIQQEIEEALQEDVGEGVVDIQKVTLDQLALPTPISLIGMDKLPVFS
jgi:regulator of protease activity HflC (stomatin/prohibitin superfamily)